MSAFRRPDPTRTFFRDAFAWHGSVSRKVLPSVVVFGAFAAAVHGLYHVVPSIALEVGPFEIAGGVLGVLLVLRMNAGYDRWWEGRKLWGGIVNQCRNLSTAAVAVGPRDQRWRGEVVRWTAAFAHAARCSLRGERQIPEIEALLGPSVAREIAAADHMPSHVARVLDRLLGEAAERGELDRLAFHALLRERMALIDHLGGCERILKTPLPRVAAIKVRRFVFLYLMTLPFGVVERAHWVVILVTAIVAYVTIGVDQVGAELENPFAVQHLSHLPLNDICATIERNVLALAEDPPVSTAASSADIA